MPLFYPFGIPTTSSYSVSASYAYKLKIDPETVVEWALYGKSGPKGPDGNPATECPPGYLNALVENTVTSSDVHGTHIHSYPALPYKYARESVAPDARANAYLLCYPIPEPTPSNLQPEQMVPVSATTQSVTASTEVVPGITLDAAVQVQNERGNPIGYPVPVYWSIVNGTGTLVSSSNTTDAAGYSQITQWIAGTTVGAQYIKAQSTVPLTYPDGDGVLFKANIVPSSSYHTQTTATLSAPDFIASTTNKIIVTVTVRDQFGNVLTQIGGVSPETLAPTNFYFTASAQNGASLGNFTCTSGVCQASLTPNNTAGTRVAVVTTINGQQLTTGGSLSLTTLPAQINYFAVTGTSTQTAGGSQNITVTAYDEFNNVCNTGTNNYTGAKDIIFSGAFPSPSPSNTNPTVSSTIFGNTTSVTFSNGVATPLSMVLYKAESALIVATSGSVTTSGGNRLSVTVSPNTGFSIGMKVAGNNTVSTAAGNSVTVDFTAYDAYRNTATGYSGIKLLKFSGASVATSGTEPTINGSTNAFKPAGVNITFGSGIASVPMVLYKAESPITIDFDNATDLGVEPLISADTLTPVTVTQGPAYTITKTAGDAQTATVNTEVGTDPQVRVLDQWQNPFIGGTVTFSITAAPGTGGAVTLFTPLTDNSGYASVGSWTLGSQSALSAGAGGNTLQASIVSTQHGTLTQTFTATAQPAALNYFDVSKSPSGNATAGTNFNVTVIARDSFGNLVDWGDNDYDGNKNIYFSGFNIAPDGINSPRTFDRNSAWQTFTSAVPVTFTNGQTINAVTLYKAESQTLTVSEGYSGGPTGRTGTLAITVDRATTTMTIKQGNAQTATVNTAVATVPQVYIRDTYLNPHVGQTVNWAPDGPGTGEAVGNASSTTDSNGMASAVSWTLGSTSGTSNNTLTASSTGYSNVVFTATAQPAAASYYTISTPGGQTAGVAFNLTVSVYDQLGNLCSFGDNRYEGNKTIYFTGPSNAIDGTVPTIAGANIGTAATVNFGTAPSAGTATVSATLYRAQTTTVTVDDGNPPSTADIDPATTGNITVSPNSPHQTESSIGAASTTIAAGSNTTLTVTSKDEWRNVKSGISVGGGGSDIVVSANGNGTIGSWTEPTPESGVYEATFTPTTTAGTYTNTITATIGGNAIVGSPITVTVTPLAINRFSVTGTSPIVAGTSTTITVTALDVYGNTATSYTGAQTITFSGATSAGGGGTPTINGAGLSPTSTSLTFTAGQVSGVSMVLYKAETAYIVATQGSYTTTGADRLTVLVQPRQISDSGYLTLAYANGGISSGNVYAGGAELTGQSDYRVTVTAYDRYDNLLSYGPNNIDGFQTLQWIGADDSPGIPSTERVPTTIGPVRSLIDDPNGNFTGRFAEPAGQNFSNGVLTTKIRLYNVATAQVQVRMLDGGQNPITGYTAAHQVIVSIGPIVEGNNGQMRENSDATPTPATVNTTVAAPSVKIMDDYGNPASGISVTFARNTSRGCIVAASGQTTNTSCVNISGNTNGSGIITLQSWTLGTEAGTNEVTAYCGTSPNSILFSTTGLADVTSKLVMYTEPPTLVTYQQTSSAFDVESAVRTQDQYNNNTSESGYTIIGGMSAINNYLAGKNFSSPSASTDSNGIATFGDGTTIREFLGPGNATYYELPFSAGWTDVTSTTTTKVYGKLLAYETSTPGACNDCGYGSGPGDCCQEVTYEYGINCADAWDTLTAHTFNNDTNADNRVGVRIRVDGGDVNLLIAQNAYNAYYTTTKTGSPGGSYPSAPSVCFVSASNAYWELKDMWSTCTAPSPTPTPSIPSSPPPTPSIPETPTPTPSIETSPQPSPEPSPSVPGNNCGTINCNFVCCQDNGDYCCGPGQTCNNGTCLEPQ